MPRPRKRYRIKSAGEVPEEPKNGMLSPKWRDLEGSAEEAVSPRGPGREFGLPQKMVGLTASALGLTAQPGLKWKFF